MSLLLKKRERCDVALSMRILLVDRKRLIQFVLRAVVAWKQASAIFKIGGKRGKAVPLSSRLFIGRHL